MKSNFTEHQQELIDLLQVEIEKDPLFIADIQQLCVDNWGEYVEKINKRRKSEHVNSLREVLYLAAPKINHKLPKTKCIRMMDGIRFVFPDGFKSCSSEADFAVMWSFVLSVKNLGWKPEDQFIKSVRDYGDYLFMLYAQRKGRRLPTAKGAAKPKAKASKKK